MESEGFSSGVSLETGELTGWQKPAEAPPLTGAVPAAEPASGMLTFESAGVADEPTVDMAFRWAKIYANDFEYKPFFDWIKARSNPERTDFAQILESIPLSWGPEQLPPPLRRHFLRKFGR